VLRTPHSSRFVAASTVLNSLNLVKFISATASRSCFNYLAWDDVRQLTGVMAYKPDRSILLPTVAMKTPQNTEAAKTYWLAVGTLWHTCTATISVDKLIARHATKKIAFTNAHRFLTSTFLSFVCTLSASSQQTGSLIRGSRTIEPTIAAKEIALTSV